MESTDFAQEIIDTINKRRDAGMSLNEALDGTGVNRDTYYKAMRNPGVAKRKLESIQKLKYVDSCYTQRGMSTDEIAQFLGVTRGQVNKYLRKLGIEHKPRERKRNISPERAAAEDKERNLLERLINVEGRTLVEISQETGLSTSVIKTRIKRYGIVRREKARKRLKKGDTADSNPLRQIIVKEWKPIKMEQRQWFTL
nr:MAG TPA: Tn7-like transposition protein D [Caudoviricetes sp.]